MKPANIKNLSDLERFLRERETRFEYHPSTGPADIKNPSSLERFISERETGFEPANISLEG